MTYFISLIISISTLFLAPQNNCEIQYDGIYKMEIDGEYAAYFKFFEGGKFLHTSSTDAHDEVMTYFNEENENMVMIGEYRLTGCTIKGKAENISGKIKFLGLVEMESMSVTFKNPRTNSSIDGIFEFYPNK